LRTNWLDGRRFGVACAIALAVALVGTRDAAASWPGANGKIAFERTGDIWVIDAGGSDGVNLTASAATELTPSWSPRGGRIAYASNVDGDFELFVMRADGSDPVCVTKSDSGDYEPNSSPNGRWLVFSSDRDGVSEIYRKKLVTGEVVRLTKNAVPDSTSGLRPAATLPIGATHGCCLEASTASS